MSRSIRAHLQSNVVGYISLFLVLSGGTAYALDGENTVFSDDIVNREVRGADIAGGAVATGHLQANAVNGTKVADGSLTGAEVDESTLFNDNSLNGSDIQDESLGTQDVDEGELVGVQTRVGGPGGGFCNPSTTAFVTCGDTVSYLFPTTASGVPEALVAVTARWETNTSGAAGSCAVFAGGVMVRGTSMGETSDTTNGTHPHETTFFAEVTGSPGTIVNLVPKCNERESDIIYDSVELFTIGDR